MIRAALLAACLVWIAGPALAHEVRPAYLELRQTAPETYDVLWKIPGHGGDQRLGIYVELPTGTTAVTVPQAAFLHDAFTERWSVRRPGGLAGGTVHIAGLSATASDVLVRVERSDGTTQVARLTPSSPSFVVEVAPGGLQVAETYLRLGVEHILLGPDHLLFVLALLILVAGRRRLVGTITAFTAAHSLSLAAATFGLVHVTPRPVEAAIALSIVFVACEIVHGRSGHPGLTSRRPWVIAFTFGLLHGLGFASALREVGLPQSGIPVALLFFNLGVEVGQLLFIASVAVVVLQARGLARRLAVRPPGWAWRIPAYSIGAIASYWTIERIAQFGSG